MKQIPGQGKSPALRAFVQAVGDDAVALALPPGLQGHAKILGHALGRRGIAVTLAKLAFDRPPSWRQRECENVAVPPSAPRRNPSQMPPADPPAISTAQPCRRRVAGPGPAIRSHASGRRSCSPPFLSRSRSATVTLVFPRTCFGDVHGDLLPRRRATLPRPAPIRLFHPRATA